MSGVKNCCTCLTRITSEDAPVLVMGAYGNPKLLCDDCASLIETMTLSRDYNEISTAMENLTHKMSVANIDDRFTIEATTKILADSAVRAQKINEGTYDFSLDDADDEESFDEIPEDLQETEEDKLLDEKDAEANAKFDKLMNKLWIVLGVGAGAYIIWKLISTYLIK